MTRLKPFEHSRQYAPLHDGETVFDMARANRSDGAIDVARWRNVTGQSGELSPEAKLSKAMILQALKDVADGDQAARAWINGDVGLVTFGECCENLGLSAGYFRRKLRDDVTWAKTAKVHAGGRAFLAENRAAAVEMLKNSDLTIAEIARAAKIGTSTVYLAGRAGLGPVGMKERTRRIFRIANKKSN